MSIFKRVFRAGEPRPVGEMAYEEVWEEFKRIVPYRDGKMFVSVLEQPEYAGALMWLTPGTECPMAKSFARAAVDYFRNPQGELDEMVMVYQPESVEKWSTPPDSSLAAVRQIVEIAGIRVIVFFKETPEAEHTKLDCAPG
jgi:hypothetical protein